MGRALVLSGAGAGLFAHGGAVRAFREAQVQFDYVSGASAGALAAGLMAVLRDHRFVMIKSLGEPQDFFRLLPEETVLL